MPDINFLFLHSFHFPKAEYFILSFMFAILLNLLAMKYLHMLLHYKCIYSFILTFGWMHIWQVLKSSIFILCWQTEGWLQTQKVANLVVNLDIQPSTAILPSVLRTAASLQALIYPENLRKNLSFDYLLKSLKPGNSSYCVLLGFLQISNMVDVVKCWNPS